MIDVRSPMYLTYAEIKSTCRVLVKFKNCFHVQKSLKKVKKDC